MKKLTSIIAICLVIILSFPSVSCKAIDKQDYCLRMRFTVSDAFSDTNYQNWLNWYVWLSDDSVMNNIRSALSNFDVSNFNDYDYYVIGISYDSQSGTQYNHTLRVWVFNSTLDPYLMYKRSANQSWSVFGDHLNNVGHYYRCSVSNLNYGSWVQDQDVSFNQTYYASNNYGYADFGYGSLLDTNVPAFNVNEYNTVNGGSPSDADYRAFCVDHSWATNLFPSTLEGYDLAGNIVDGDPVPVFESNSNHMYFQNCDLGFCEPTDIKNFTSFGGAYLYCKYTLDNWVVNHINDYQLQFNVVSVIGSEQNNFSYSMRVDRNGFVTIPFSYLFESQSSSAIPINRGFAAVVTNQKLGSDYNIAHLYSVANSNVPNFIRTLGAEYNYNLTDLGWSALKGGTLKYLCAWVSDGGTISMNNLADWSENVAQSFNPYILRVNVKLVSGNDVSGDYAEKFDLYAGDQSTVDTSGLVNNDPFVPDVDQDDGDLPSVPEDPNSTTPSAIVYTGGTFTGNFNGVIGYDPGYSDLKSDLDADPNGNFTQYLDPMHNDEVGSWFMSFVNAMPSEMKAILVTGAGVGVFFGLYRFIRRG